MKSPTVDDNARFLTVALCQENLMRLDDLIALRGELTRYIQSREFFARELERCLRKREEPFHDHREHRSNASAR